MTEDNVSAVRLMIDTDKRTYQPIRTSLGIGMSQVYEILDELSTILPDQVMRKSGKTTLQLNSPSSRQRLATCRQTKHSVGTLGVEILAHSPYSPHLAPAVHFIAPSRDPLAKFQKCFSICFVVKESRKTMPRDYDAGARLGLCTLSPEDWAFFENVQYILDLIRGARAVRRILQLNLFRY
ncbi:hypothetical protein EVAR_84593_1 [Eumeta japonica]|uniref:Mariner Mos1 transposase n=1 Tax=Eumeta variegata TaxID=151549 RepID=A0A4C1ZGP0_EUMVA|nr:hypothetical protein EVAR_84593_1 [Eumeta japonica]